MQRWDDCLYPAFRDTIRGSYYGVITKDLLDEGCYYLACRAIATFKFPHISLEYTTYYAKTDDNGNTVEVADDDTDGVPHAYFNSDEVGSSEVSIIIAWMKVYWCDRLMSNSNNYEDIYTDSNIKTFSKANAIDKWIKQYSTYRADARELEEHYSRVNTGKSPAVGDINV